MTIQIRPMERADIPRVLPLVRATHPCRVLTEEVMRWRYDHPRPGSRESALVAVHDETIIGFLRSVLREEDRRGLSTLATVATSHRNTDVGSRLLEASERDLVAGGAEVLRTEAAHEGVQAGGEAFREAVLERGYAPEDTHHVLGLDLSELPDVPTAPAGVEVRPFADQDPRAIYEVDRLTTRDEPGADSWFPSYEDWHENVWGFPLTALDLCLLVLVEDVPAAITCYVSDGATRMDSSITGTPPEFRGRGLAGYAKTVALHRARRRGITHAYTGNHEDNAPMLAINERLGYVPVGSEITYVRKVRG